MYPGGKIKEGVPLGQHIHDNLCGINLTNLFGDLSFLCK